MHFVPTESCELTVKFIFLKKKKKAKSVLCVTNYQGVLCYFCSRKMFVQFCVFFFLPASMRVVVATVLSLSSEKPHVAFLQPSFFIKFLFMLSDSAVWVARSCHMALNLLHVYRWNRCVFDGHTQLVRTIAIVICPPASRFLSPRAEM